MNRQPFPFPALSPLMRLNVRDDLKINAERWALAHGYHRQRQNVVYQSLWEPGIVCGLGVKVIAQPETAAAQFRDRRWLEVQPGIAIDLRGNPIIVSPEDDRTYRIAAPVPDQGSLTIHVVIRYVDPDGLELNHDRDRVAERYRFDQRSRSLEPADIELCRIELASSPNQGGDVQIQIPTEPRSPAINELDLRYRQSARLRCQAHLQLGVLSELSHQTYQNLTELTRSLAVLYPDLTCQLETLEITANLPTETAAQLIYLPAQQLLDWQSTHDARKLDVLGQYLKAKRGLLLVEASHQHDQKLWGLLDKLAEHQPLDPVSEHHPIMKQPFLFGCLPQIAADSLELYQGGNVLLAMGNLSDPWSGRHLSRLEIREAQEFGINLLYFAWQENLFTRLLQ
ncbi:hypothetical protein [Sphaerothrix gracilis]|uniref:hypothetical protein n=1 Tax=Sphaerothrix gracilis TaxID=3151835 RepID=UPI0031FD9371